MANPLHHNKNTIT